MSYAYIESPKGSYAELNQLINPIGLVQDYQRWSDLRSDMYRNGFSENPRPLMFGVINLINLLIKNEEASNPIQTLLFLDKSARNAAYLFNVTWEKSIKLLSANGHRQYKKPNIRFINIGHREDQKHHDKSALKLLGKIYHREDFTGRLLIVDEYVDTGSSIRKAGKSLLDAKYNPRSIEGIANFTSLPNWYHIDEVKGVDSVPLISPETRKTANTVFIKRFTTNILSNGTNKAGNSDQINIYSETVGGFLSLPPKKEDRQKIRSYRINLRKMVNESFDRKLITI